MAIDPIADGEGLASVRAKNNAAIEGVNTAAQKVAALEVRGTLPMVARPGDDGLAYSSATTGPASARPIAGFGEIVVDTDLGFVLEIDGADIDPGLGYRDIALRVDFAFEEGHTYRVDYMLKRATNPTDPEGHGIELRLQNLSASKAHVSNIPLGPVLSPAVADGVVTRSFLIGKAGAPGTLDYTIPPTSRYGVPFIRVYGSGQTTRLAVIGRIEDVTDTLLSSATAAGLQAAIDGQKNEIAASVARADLGARTAQQTGYRYPNLALGAKVGYIGKTNGLIGTSTDWRYVDFIEVTPTTRLIRDGIGWSAAFAATPLACYDANKQFLGSPIALTTGFINARPADLVPGTAFIRLSYEPANVPDIRVVDEAVLSGARRYQRYTGRAGNSGALTDSGYIAKTTGVLAVATPWRTTPLIPVTADSIVVRQGNALPRTFAAAPVSFFDGGGAYLGYYSPLVPDEEFTVGDLAPTAAFIRASFDDIATGGLIVRGSTQRGTVDLLKAGLLADFALTTALSTGYLDLATGGVTSSANWRATDFVPAVPGQQFLLTSMRGNATVCHVAMYDASKTYLGSALAGIDPAAERYQLRDAIVTAGHASVAYVRAAFPSTAAYSFLGARVGGAGQAATSALTYLAPAVGYARQGEPIYLYARGILADRSVSLAWNISEANAEVCTITPASTADITVKLRAMAGASSAAIEVASFPIKVAPAAPVSPLQPMNIITLGDSTTDTVLRASVSGLWANELSRRLTGVGTAALAGAQSPAALALNNIKFRGTRGDQPIKHEGRPGWAASDYLTAASVGAVTNAFWNPATSQFDLDYYLTQNAFRDGDVTGGVNSTGSNLLVVIQLGWNSVYTQTVAASVAELLTLIDLIKVGRSGVKIWVLGLPPAPPINFKDFTGTRYVSEREVFELAVKTYGAAYRDLCAGKTNVDFVQISHLIDVEAAYPYADRARSPRSTGTVRGATDHVHHNAAGYAMLADALYYKFLYDYCRGV